MYNMDLNGKTIGLIAILAFIVFGSKRLPDAARSLGRSIRIFKSEIEADKDTKPADDADTHPEK